MAQRGAWTPQKVRDRIRVSMLTRRLQDSALGRLKDKEGNIIELPDGQRKAIEILLKKTLPDLQSVEHRGDPEAPIRITVTESKL
jgi:hypothetical protein